MAIVTKEIGHKPKKYGNLSETYLKVFVVEKFVFERGNTTVATFVLYITKLFSRYKSRLSFRLVPLKHPENTFTHLQRSLTYAKATFSSSQLTLDTLELPVLDP